MTVGRDMTQSRVLERPVSSSSMTGTKYRWKDMNKTKLKTK